MEKVKKCCLTPFQDTAENAAEVAEIEQEEPAVEASSQPAPPPEEPKVAVATPDPTDKAPAAADTVAMVADSPDSETAPAESTAVDPTPSDPSPSEADAPPAMEEPTVTKADTPPEPESSPLLAIPGLQTSLEGYLKTHSTMVGNLATSYLRGLNSRLERAADAGDLPLVEAFRGEQEKIGNLQEELASHPADLIARVTQKVTLPSLDEEAPGELVELRQIWTGERQKIRESLDLDLQQSLKALESQLTRERDFDNAKKVSTYRESLAEAVGSDSATTTVNVASAPASPSSQSDGDNAAPIQGRLRFQGAFDGGTTKDFSAADGITEFVEVHLTTGNFLALRANGKIVTSSVRVNDHGVENFVRICPGLGMVFFEDAVGIDQSGKGHYLYGRTNYPVAPLQEQPHSIADVIVSSKYSLLLLSDGSIRWWGSNYEGANGIPKWPEPPEEARQGIQAIALHHDFAAVLTKTGQVIAWTKDGVWDLPRNFDRNVTKIGAAWNALTALNDRGEAFCILTGQSEIGPFEYRNASDLKSIPVGQEVSAIQLEDGTWLHAYKPDEAPPYGLRRFPNVVNELPKIPILSERSFDIITHGNRKADAIAWIEPVDAGEEATTTPPIAESTIPSSSTLAGATKDRPFENSLGMKFIPVPIKGGPTDGQPVLFSIWETRVGDYAAFIKKNKDHPWPDPGFKQGDDHPAVMVSWEDAVDFCEWLTKEDQKKGTLRKDELYRLPTDHEWSCAVGIGEMEDSEKIPSIKDKEIGSLYPWGEKFPPPKGAGNYSGKETTRNPLRGIGHIEGYDDGYDRTAPVGNFEANEHGLYDMGGNVWEFCEDWYTAGEKRVMRGGSLYNSRESDLLSSIRSTTRLNNAFIHGGFRVVLSRK